MPEEWFGIGVKNKVGLGKKDPGLARKATGRVPVSPGKGLRCEIDTPSLPDSGDKN